MISSWKFQLGTLNLEVIYGRLGDLAKSQSISCIQESKYLRFEFDLHSICQIICYSSRYRLQHWFPVFDHRPRVICSLFAFRTTIYDLRWSRLLVALSMRFVLSFLNRTNWLFNSRDPWTLLVHYVYFCAPQSPCGWVTLCGSYDPPHRIHSNRQLINLARQTSCKHHRAISDCHAIIALCATVPKRSVCSEPKKWCS